MMEVNRKQMLLLDIYRGQKRKTGTDDSRGRQVQTASELDRNRREQR